jgi:hypothetical protein
VPDSADIGCGDLTLGALARGEAERYELTRTIDPAHFFPTVGAAVAAFREQFGADRAPAAGNQAR